MLFQPQVGDRGDLLAFVVLRVACISLQLESWYQSALTHFGVSNSELVYSRIA